MTTAMPRRRVNHCEMAAITGSKQRSSRLPIGPSASGQRHVVVAAVKRKPIEDFEFLHPIGPNAESTAASISRHRAAAPQALPCPWRAWSRVDFHLGLAVGVFLGLLLELDRVTLALTGVSCATTWLNWRTIG